MASGIVIGKRFPHTCDTPQREFSPGEVIVTSDEPSDSKINTYLPTIVPQDVSQKMERFPLPSAPKKK